MNAASDRTGKADINERICSRTEDISMNGRLDLRSRQLDRISKQEGWTRKTF